MLSAKRSVATPALFINCTKRFATGRSRFGSDVASAAQTAGMAGDQQRQIGIRMRVAVAQRAAVENRGMVEQRAVSVRRGFQPLHEPGEQLDVEGS